MIEYFAIIFIPHNIIKHSMKVQNISAYSVNDEKMNIFLLKCSTSPLLKKLYFELPFAEKTKVKRNPSANEIIILKLAGAR